MWCPPAAGEEEREAGHTEGIGEVREAAGGARPKLGCEKSGTQTGVAP